MKTTTTEKTYHNRTIFKLECEECHRSIYPSETYAVEYYNRKTNKNINVLEAYELRATDKQSKVFCILCKPKPIIRLNK